MTALDLSRPLVVGFGVTGAAVAEALVDHGVVPQVIDDRPTPETTAHARDLGLELSAPDRDWVEILNGRSLVLPSPGIPAHHPVFAAAAAQGVPVASEFDLAALWDERPLVGITGTNGKTTVTLLVTDALRRSGRRSVAVGNTELPLVSALTDPCIDSFVVEASSFRLAHSISFSPAIATWLNFAPDHLDAHPDLEAYEVAKASIWSHLGPEGIAVANEDDATVMGHVPAGANVVTFGLTSGDWRCEEGSLIGPDGPFVDIAALPRRQPHDLSNALATAATATAAGATPAAVAESLLAFTGLPHRLEFIAEADGVRWFNDSKATVPHATLADISGFDSVVLIAGGRNKGLDLRPLGDAVPPVRAVVATGDAASEVSEAFAAKENNGVPVEVRHAADMTTAVQLAAELSNEGDTVVLAPACTSFDWYPNYGSRGDHFVELVRDHLCLPKESR